MKERKILRNAIKCKHCGNVIESKTVHDYKECSCGTVAVDGGKEYLRRSFKTSPDVDYEDLSEYEEIDAESSTTFESESEKDCTETCDCSKQLANIGNKLKDEIRYLEKWKREHISNIDAALVFNKRLEGLYGILKDLEKAGGYDE
jgi:hypothetical protein